MLALINFENLATIRLAIDNPYLASPALRHYIDRTACTIHKSTYVT